MKKFISVLTTLFFSFSSLAQIEIKQGEQAPFEGILLTKEQVAKILAEKKTLEEKHNIALEYEKNKSQINLEAIKDSKQLIIDSQKEKSDFLLSSKDKELDRVYKQLEEESGDYSIWWLASGFVIGTVTSVLIFFSAVEIKKL